MEDKEREESKKSGFAWYKWMWRLLFLLIGIPFLLFLLLQVPAVQNWSVDRLTSYFSKKMNTKVEIDKVDLSIWRGLELDGFYVEDQSGDTLIYSEHLEVGLQKSLFSIFTKELSLNDVRLVNGHVHIVKRRNQSQSNIEVLLASLGNGGSKEASKPGDPYNLELKVVQLKNVHYQMEDENLGRTQSYQITEGVVEFDNIDLANGNIGIKRIFLDRPDIVISRNAQKVIIVDEATGQVDTIIVEPVIDTSKMLVTLDELEILEGTFKRLECFLKQTLTMQKSE